MCKDQNFDGLTDHFEKKIYGSMKGQIRLDLLQAELQHQILNNSKSALNVLDLAGGLGQMSIWFAKKGHRVTYVDISAEMIERARHHAKANQVEHLIQWVQAPFQDFILNADKNHSPRKYDLILAHALLEWLGEPLSGLDLILQYAEKQAHISLSFYNVQAIKLHNVLRGNFRKVNSGDFKGEPGGLTPTHPLNPNSIRAAIKKAPFDILSEMGLRSFYDYLPKPVKEKISAEDILAMEQQLAHQQPFIDMARYIHLLLKPRLIEP